MMYNIFPTVLNMSLTGSVCILAVIFARLCMKRLPKICSYGLWLVVLLRLLCPLSFSSAISLFQVVEAPVNSMGQVRYIPDDMTSPDIAMRDYRAARAIAVAKRIVPVTDKADDVTPIQILIGISTAVWIIGIVLFVFYFIISLFFLYRKLASATDIKNTDMLGTYQIIKDLIPDRTKIMVSDCVDTPFLIGIIKPTIYLPSDTNCENLKYILLHEAHHIKRYDYIVKMLAFIALAIHWFNPFVWVAFVLAMKDMEMSCDEAVMNTFSRDERKSYAGTLLSMAVKRTSLSGIHLAFGESSIKSRIKNIVNWEKAKKWVKVLGTVACTIIIIVLALNPEAKDKSNKIYENNPSTSTDYLATERVDEESRDEVSRRKKAALRAFANDFAIAFCNKDAATLSKWCSPEIVEKIIPKEITDTFDYSMQWPWGYEEADSSGMRLTYDNYNVEYADEERAEILYYAWDLRPHVTVWRQTVYFNYNEQAVTIHNYSDGMEGTPYATEEDVTIYNYKASDEMSPNTISGADTNTGMDYLPMEEAENIQISGDYYPVAVTDVVMDYGDGSAPQISGIDGWRRMYPGINNTPMDYLTNGAGEILNSKALLSSSEEYKPLFTARTAAIYLLNLLENDNKVKVSEYVYDLLEDKTKQRTEEKGTQTGDGLQKKDEVRIRITFVEDNTYVDIKMIRPFGDSGIWIPMNANDDISLSSGITPAEYWYSDDYRYYQEMLGEDFLTSYDSTFIMSSHKRPLVLEKTERIATAKVFTSEKEDCGFVTLETDGIYHTEFAHTARAGWNNIFIGYDEDIGDFLIRVSIEERDNHGQYQFFVYRPEEDAVIEFKGLQYTWDESRPYSEADFYEWISSLLKYLDKSDLLLSSQNGEIVTIDSWTDKTVEDFIHLLLRK